jgi:tRNA uracil 4-sulfurtransferase
MYKVIMINVDELWLKGKNRPQYFRAIKGHIEEVVSSYHPHKFKVGNESQRMIVRSEDFFNEDLFKALQNVPGIHSFSPTRDIDLDYELLYPAIKEELLSWGDELPRTFKVNTKRTLKTFEKTSMEVSRHMGHLVLQEFDSLKVDVKKPQLCIELRILPEKFFVSTHKYMGIGGLPVGTNGHLITLLSGGFDSPVASYMMSKRGCRQSFVFFYAYPFVGEEVKDKIVKLMEVLATFQKGTALYIVPFGNIQKKIAKTCKEDYRTMLFRKYMVDCANILAGKVGAKALLTGDALGQVSSQTIGNIGLIDSITNRPVLRPLIGFNKMETILKSKDIGTHDISIIPHDDACSLFAPKHPVIHPDNKYWLEYCSGNEYGEEIQNALNNALKIQFNVKGESNYSQ